MRLSRGLVFVFILVVMLLFIPGQAFLEHDLTDARDYYDDDIDHTQIPFFSNPDALHFGVPKGPASDGDNTRTFREERHVSGDYQATGDVDLVVQSLTVAPSSSQLGTELTATVVIKNEGSGDAESWFYIEFYDHKDSAPDPGELSFYYEISNGLAAGATETFHFNFTPTLAGSFRAWAQVDSSFNYSDNPHIYGPVHYTVSSPASWQRIATDDARDLAFGYHFGDYLAASFDVHGVYLYDFYGSQWHRIAAVNAQVLAFGPGGVVAASFDGHGVFLRHPNDGIWTRIATTPARALDFDDYTGLLAASFDGLGVYLYDGSWTRIATADAQIIVSNYGVVIASFEGHGVHYYHAGEWIRLSAVDASALALGHDGDMGYIAASFDGHGVWVFVAGWIRIAGLDARALAIDDSTLLLSASFDGYGVYLYNPFSNTWGRIATTPARVLDYQNGVLASSFDGLGVWLYE